MAAKKNNLPAIEGGEPVRPEFLPFYRPAIGDDDVEAVGRALRSGWLTMGPETERFETALKEYLGVRHVAPVNSCSAAMFLALKALDIGTGDEVITSALTFASTVHAIVHAGATPVLADIENETFGPSPQDIRRRATDRTRVIMPVHFGGQACRIDEICSHADSAGLRVVEDAAHSFGAVFDNRKLGRFGDATTFSFYATKNMTSGEGGCLATDDDDIAERFRRLSYHGMSRDSWERYTERGSWYYEVETAGYKHNMSDILSALGMSQLRKVDRLLAERATVAGQLAEGLSESPFVELPQTRDGNTHTWHLFVILLKLENLTIDRQQFTKALAAENIGSSVHFIPVYKHPFFKPYLRGDTFPVCDNYYSRCISLPIFPGMREEDVSDVVRAIDRIASFYAKT